MATQRLPFKRDLTIAYCHDNELNIKASHANTYGRGMGGLCFPVFLVFSSIFIGIMAAIISSCQFLTPKKLASKS